MRRTLRAAVLAAGLGPHRPAVPPMNHDDQTQHAGLRYREAMRGVLEHLVARAREERALAEHFVIEAEALLAQVQP